MMGDEEIVMGRRKELYRVETIIKQLYGEISGVQILIGGEGVLKKIWGNFFL